MRLLKLSKEEYLVIDKDNAKYFSSLDKLMHSKMIPAPELTVALSYMILENHNYTEFGDVNKEFMYTGKL
jgi:hypothetical protein